MRLRIFLAVVAVTALLLPATAAHAAEIETLVSFDAVAGELPEGVAIDARGNIFVSLTAPVSEIRKIAPDGEQSTLVDLGIGGFGPLGLAVDAHGNVYVAAASFDPATQGVYRVSPSGTATRLPGTEDIGSPTGWRSTSAGTSTSPTRPALYGGSPAGARPRSGATIRCWWATAPPVRASRSAPTGSRTGTGRSSSGTRTSAG